MKKENLRYIIKIGIVVLLLGIANFYIFYTQRSVKNSPKDTLLVGMELKFPPFETTDTSGNPIGVSVDLANEIAKKLDKKVEIISLDFSSLIPALQTHKIDIILSSMTITKDREETISFSNEYARSDLGLAINKNNKITNFKELNKEGINIAVKRGTIGETWAHKHLPLANIKPFTEVSAALFDVNNHSSDAFIYDPLTLIEGSKNLSNVSLILDPLPDVKGWGIGIRKDDTLLKYGINQALEEIKKDGFFDIAREKYLKEDVEKYKSHGLEYFF